MIRKILLALIIAVGLSTIGFLAVGRQRYYHLELKSCFNDVQGLKAGASVRIAGVDVGSVRQVKANPNTRNCPAEVDMRLATTYEITVPKDAIAGIATAGLLGETYVEMDTAQAEGGPSENYGYLKSKQSNPMPSLADYLKVFDEHLRTLDVITGLVEASKAKEGSNHNSKPLARPFR
jgi:phospholipid/cholesterol/gamma-HCH transport system substrate-binding protein